MSDLPKTFDPAAIEARWYAHWEEHGLFRPERLDAEPFTIVNPPPNVTGSLHIGHALDNTLQDIVVRYERMRGKDALWVVGTDHAGIATQMVVERNLASQGVKRTDMGRDEFVQHVWEWKEQSGGTITRQLRRLGCSMDWSREQFTMDPHFTRAVTKVFVDLYNDGLIYRDKRLVNWDPKLKTAISDLEVETRDVQGGFWTFRYPLADGSGEVRVSTTRPETMLADMAVAVHPSDERYRELVARGAKVRLPITGREIPIIADEHADPELGSGAVKITPGHDFNDFEVARRAGIAAGEMLNMLDADAAVVQCGGVPDELIGLDRFAARERVVAMMKEQGFLIPHIDKDGAEHDAEPRTIPTPFGDRGGVPIEPWLTDQWYVDAAKLAEKPIAAVRSGEVEIVPKTWEKTFFNWMENIQPWCVSRQLWWGHRVPAWYGPKRDDSGVFVKAAEDAPAFATTGQMRAVLDKQVFAAHSEQEALEQAQAYYGAGVEVSIGDGVFSQNQVSITQDPDVLDTWFSSALWPFATLGWPEEPSPLAGEGGAPQGAEGEGSVAQVAAGAANPSPNPLPQGERASLLHKHYPNDLLISGFDILFFWDARMMMMGYYNMGQAPWKRLYLHGLVRAADGQKMSKSKGNVVDPLGLIDRYGADALRFFMAATESQGRDIKLDERRVEGYRNFATKLWNATRFCQANGIGGSTTVAAPQATLTVNRWIVGEVVETVAALDKALADLRFDAAANVVYHFVWDRFCDWYLELIKGQIDEETRAVAGWVLDQILVMLHPFMPFVTEELWQAQGSRADYPLITARWPEPEAEVDAAAKRQMLWLINAVTQIRSARNELSVPPSLKLDAWLYAESPFGEETLSMVALQLRRLARLEYIHRPQNNGFGRAAWPELPEGAKIELAVEGGRFIIPLEGVIDVAAEKARLEKARAVSEKERDALAKRLENPSFVDRAKPEAVEKARADHATHAAEAERLAGALARLG